MALASLAVALFATALALLAVGEAWRARRADHRGREIERLAYLGKTVVELHEHIIAAIEGVRLNGWPRVRLKQLEVRGSLAALGDKYELDVTRALVAFLAGKDRANEVYDASADSLIEIEKALTSLAGGTAPPGAEESEAMHELLIERRKPPPPKPPGAVETGPPD